MKVFNSLKCDSGFNFPTIESNMILTTSTAYDTDTDYSVLIDDNGNVLTRNFI